MLPARLAALLVSLLAVAVLAAPAAAATLDAGGETGCAVRDDGRLLCWGAADLLPSVGYPYGSLSAVPADAIADAADVAVGATQACAVRAGGAVVCWDDDSLALDPGVADAVAVTAGDAHACALLRDGRVRCWGEDAAGQLGGGDGGGVSGVVSLDAGADVTCAALATGAVGCWGGPAPSAQPPALADAAAVATGDGHACALRRGGTVICWGANDHGQLGLGGGAPSAGPRDVPGLGGVTAIAAGGEETCALRADRTVACWGAGSSGQLGDGLLLDRAAPVTVSGLSGATAVTVGERQACALTADGGALCWGANGSGQLGNDRSARAATPVAVGAVGNAATVATGPGGHRCATTAGDGRVLCWGAGEHGQLGDGARTTRVVPTAVSGISLADAVSVGNSHTCALLDEHVECWGEGTDGRLGNGTTSDRAAPVPVAGLQALQVSAGYRGSCAVTLEATVACWGARYVRADPPTPAHWQQLLTPTAVAGTADAVEVVAMNDAACALFVDETVRCWGLSDDGQLGVGWHTIDSGSTDPVQVTYQDGTPLTGVTELRRARASAICAALADESFVCWGDRYGDYATAMPALSAFPLPDGDGCVLDGRAVRCVGDGARGQLGDGYQPGGHFPLQPQAAAVVGIGGAVRQPAAPPSRDVTETPPPLGDGGVTPVPLPPRVPAAPLRPAAPKAFAITRVRGGRAGRVVLTLAVPAAGGVRVSATATVAGRRVSWFATARALSVRAGARVLTFSPTAAARRALKLKRARGAVRVALRVTYTPKQGGRAVVRTATVSVRR